jgi:hypothetical protein
MRKVTVVCIFLLSFCAGRAQGLKPNEFRMSYFGETITHPGVRVKLDYHLKEWDKVNRRDKTIHKKISVGPGLAFFYHKRYQTGVLTNFEIKLSRSKSKSFFFSYGLGVGYLATFATNTYEVDETGEVKKTIGDNHYFAPNLFCEFGGTILSRDTHDIGYLISPNISIAMPNFPSAVGYAFLELGLTYRIR